MSASGRGARSRDERLRAVFASREPKRFLAKKHVRRHNKNNARKRLASPARCRVSVVRASPRCHFSARNACERVGRARTPSPPPQTLSSPPARRHGAWSEPRAVQREESEEAGWQQGQHGGPDPPGPSGEVRDAISRLVLSFPDTSARVASVRAERTCHAVGFARHASASRPGRSRSIEPRRRPFLSRSRRKIDRSVVARSSSPSGYAYRSIA